MTRFVIVGTGPAGISAARPLLEAGHEVVLLDAGTGRLAPPPADRPALPDQRRLGRSHLLGPDLGGLRDMAAYSPKLRTCASPDFVDGYAPGNRLEPHGFALVGTMAAGGLSNLWGAVCSAFDDDDLGGALPAAALDESYRRVAQRLGLSGTDGDDMASFHGRGLPLQPALPLTPMAQGLLDRYRQQGGAGDFSLGRSRLAVRSEGAHACVLDQLCLWGCGVGAIYNSADELDQLRAFPHLTVEPSVTVTRVGPGWAEAVRDGEILSFRGDRVLLAAGPPASARLALAAMGWVDKRLPIRNAPAFAFAMALPARLGRGLPNRGFGLSQLSFRLDLGGPMRNHALGLLYDAATLAAPDIAAHLPLTRRGAADFLRALMPGLALGLVYLPGEYSANSVTLRADGILDIQGGHAPDFYPAMRRTLAGLGRNFRRLGAWILPGSASAYLPGAEVHYGAVLPVGQVVSALGELPGVPGVHVIDGAVLPRVPAKHHTFAVMANADRIACKLAGEASS
jgi:hypothetical protein